MKRTFWIFAVASLFSGFPVFGAAQPPARITLDEAKRFAVQHNFEVTALRREVDEKRAGPRTSVEVVTPAVFYKFGRKAMERLVQSSKAQHSESR